MSAPLQIPLALSPSEAAALLHALEHAIDDAPPFDKSRLESVRDKVNLALYGNATPERKTT